MSDLYTAPSLKQQHLRTVRNILGSRQEGDWHDFKVFVGNDAEKLRKDLVALANTPGGPYAGFGYLVIGVTDTAEVVGLSGKDAEKTEDARANQIMQLIQSGVAPYIDAEVLEDQIDGKRIHVIVVPETGGVWHQVTADKDPGFWIRRGRASVHPKFEDFSRYEQRRTEQLLQPLRSDLANLSGQFTSLEARYVELLSAQLTGQSASTAAVPYLDTTQLIQQAYDTPVLQIKRRLQADVADFAATFSALYNDQTAAEQSVQDVGLWTDRLEHLEALTRPLGQALAAAVLLGPEEFGPVIILVLEQVSRTVCVWPVWNSMLALMEEQRAYPLTLLVFAVTVAACQKQRGLLLNTLAQTKTEQFNRQRSLLESTRALVNVGKLDSFARASGQGCAPMYERLHRIVTGPTGWLTSLLALDDPQDLAMEADLLQTLSYLGVASAQSVGVDLIPNDLLYHRNSEQIIRAAYENKRKLLEEATDGKALERIRMLAKHAAEFERPRFRCHTYLVKNLADTLEQP